jgi:hypothetical protein
MGLHIIFGFMSSHVGVAGALQSIHVCVNSHHLAYFGEC